MQLDLNDLRPAARERMTQLSGEGELDLETLRMGKGIDPHAQIDLAREIRINADTYGPLLTWSRFPTWDQLLTCSNLIWDFLVRDNRLRSGVSSGRQLAFRINQLRRHGGASALFKAELHRQPGRSSDDIVEEVMDFLRNWANFNFPRFLMTVDRIHRTVFTKLGRPSGDYSFFAGQVENWFVDSALMALDEYGIPIQVAQKIQSLLRPEGDLDAVLRRVKELRVDDLPLSTFEKSLLVNAMAYINV